MKRDYLITGGAGWLGTRVVEAVLKGLVDYDGLGADARTVKVFAGPLDDVASLGSDVEWVSGDLREVEDRKNFVSSSAGSTLIHLAGVIHPRLFTKEFFVINQIATVDLVKQAIGQGIKSIVVMSSNSPFGANDTPSGLFDETSSYNPYMGYGRSKMLMEQEVIKLAADNPETNLTLVRAPWFYGPNQPPRQSEFFKMVRKGVFPLFGAGQNKRSMAYLDNLAAGILLASKRGSSSGNIFWIADAKPHSMLEILNTVKEVMGEDFGMSVSKRQIYLPATIADLARVGDGFLQSMGLYHQKVHVLSEMNLTISCSIHKASTELGYEPKVSLREGMRRSIDWCLTNGVEI